jgi:hypothetical protein
MGKTTRREYLITVPDKYWVSSLSNIKWITKENNAKAVKRNKAI